MVALHRREQPVWPQAVSWLCTAQLCRVHLTVGRFNELLNEGACTWLGSVDAKNMLALAISQGLPYGDDPVVGGVVCFDSAADGHCYVIEQVIDNDTVIASESGWNYTTAPVVKTFTRTRSGGAWQYQSGYTYQGIIYPPGTPPGPSGGGDDEDYYIIWLQGEGYGYQQ